ncbi:ubiquitin-like protein, putative [Plasmodium berghei]|uniref:Ubiquitin-like protein, putative n=2 Tax=Plasmodium berghei TaxID=5821 RepID=A0A509ALM6_PLABA|nr:ubiquitin-like protein, putative [Plasmodium berghei ANKA]CXI42065.1 ubiquitin-like protein, putative [Plasmodium berghei]SCM22033.1 ubiquitin-like protein, putative [Plasmodium berghei]SCN25236.1 ubiquitin-like protein, putative [Plasmodium berghei]SCO60226.1 ubiquitin-like protein, putative [Plasmodium berghei]SCO61861.1 ubiquitin-like protein, putative [Plasmodium berghei]|eukprot:XP_034421515.1 ubiquitin-like protein, putative [Plasmodium berghei ANKA]
MLGPSTNKESQEKIIDYEKINLSEYNYVINNSDHSDEEEDDDDHHYISDNNYKNDIKTDYNSLNNNGKYKSYMNPKGFFPDSNGKDNTTDHINKKTGNAQTVNESVKGCEEKRMSDVKDIDNTLNSESTTSTHNNKNNLINNNIVKDEKGRNSQEDNERQQPDFGSYIYVRIKTNSSNNNVYKCKIEKNISIKKLKNSLKEIINDNNDYRIIYRGRLLKDMEILSKYNIMFNDVLYAIKLNKKRNENDVALDSGITSSQLSTIGDEYNDLGKMGQNDNISKLISSMFDNSDFLKSIMNSNKQLQKLREKNSELNHMLNDSQTLKQSFEMIKNPSLMKELMRNTDRAISNIEAIPGGFNTLRRMYHNIQEPMYASVEISNEKNQNTIKEYDLNSSSPPTTEAFPNPWASKENNSQKNINMENRLNKYLLSDSNMFNDNGEIIPINKMGTKYKGTKGKLIPINNTNENNGIENGKTPSNDLFRSNLFDMLLKYKTPVNVIGNNSNNTATKSSLVANNNIASNNNKTNNEANKSFENSAMNIFGNNGNLFDPNSMNSILGNDSPINNDLLNTNLFNSLMGQNQNNENSNVLNMLNQMMSNLNKNMNMNNNGNNANLGNEMLNSLNILNFQNNRLNSLFNHGVNMSNKHVNNNGNNISNALINNININEEKKEGASSDDMQNNAEQHNSDTNPELDSKQQKDDNTDLNNGEKDKALTSNNLNKHDEQERLIALYQDQLTSLELMGFTDIDKCIKSLVQANGNIERAIDLLLSDINANRN